MSQTQYDRFLIAYADFSSQSTSLNTMVQQYKNMKDGYFNCSIASCRLAWASIFDSIANPLYAYSTPSRLFGQCVQIRHKNYA